MNHDLLARAYAALIVLAEDNHSAGDIRTTEAEDGFIESLSIDVLDADGVFVGTLTAHANRFTLEDR
jgi:hypothetical protein